jgi:hypothetical protein
VLTAYTVQRRAAGDVRSPCSRMARNVIKVPNAVRTASWTVKMAHPNEPSPIEHLPMQAETLTWHPELHQDYDIGVGTAAGKCLETLRTSSSDVRKEFVVDPRDVHRQLFCMVAPLNQPEYAGSYRGTLGTSLESRVVTLASQIGLEPQRLQSPALVLGDMTGFYNRWVNEYFRDVASLERADVIRLVSRVFYAFGRIHPFLDGNGHVQRLIVAACLFERTDMKLLPSWTIHPRPYDIEFARALEGRKAAESLDLLQPLLSAYIAP